MTHITSLRCLLILLTLLFIASNTTAQEVQWQPFGEFATGVTKFRNVTLPTYGATVGLRHGDPTETHSDRTAYIVKQFLALLDTGICRTEREVSYFAERLNVSPKYLSATVKRVTGHSVSSFINRATVSILKKKLNDERLSLTQIADQMNFNTLSHFSRYCTKHHGLSPSDYRRNLQPKL